MYVFKDFPGLENLGKKFTDFQEPARALYYYNYKYKTTTITATTTTTTLLKWLLEIIM